MPGDSDKTLSELMKGHYNPDDWAGFKDSLGRMPKRHKIGLRARFLPNKPDDVSDVALSPKDSR
jgi:hypothetical protein